MSFTFLIILIIVSWIQLFYCWALAMIFSYWLKRWWGGGYVPSVEGACNFSRNVVLLCLCFDSMKTLLLGWAVPSCQQSLRVPVQKPAVDGEWTKPEQYLSYFANTEHFVRQIFKRWRDCSILLKIIYLNAMIHFKYHLFFKYAL